jgi:hypothetical protein
MGNLYRRPSIDASYQVSVTHLAKGNVSFCHHLASVVRRLFTFHILIFSSETPYPNELEPNQLQELPVAAMFVNESGQNGQSL